jgi:hypothetical protein
MEESLVSAKLAVLRPALAQVQAELLYTQRKVKSLRQSEQHLSVAISVLEELTREGTTAPTSTPAPERREAVVIADGVTHE